MDLGYVVASRVGVGDGRCYLTTFRMSTLSLIIQACLLDVTCETKVLWSSANQSGSFGFLRLDLCAQRHIRIQKTSKGRTNKNGFALMLKTSKEQKSWIPDKPATSHILPVCNLTPPTPGGRVSAELLPSRVTSNGLASRSDRGLHTRVRRTTRNSEQGTTEQVECEATSQAQGNLLTF